MKYVVSTAGDAEIRPIMLETDSDEVLQEWMDAESYRPHLVVEAESLEDLSEQLKVPVMGLNGEVIGLPEEVSPEEEEKVDIPEDDNSLDVVVSEDNNEPESVVEPIQEDEQVPEEINSDISDISEDEQEAASEQETEQEVVQEQMHTSHNPILSQYLPLNPWELTTPEVIEERLPQEDQEESK